MLLNIAEFIIPSLTPIIYLHSKQLKYTVTGQLESNTNGKSKNFIYKLQVRTPRGFHFQILNSILNLHVINMVYRV